MKQRLLFLVACLALFFSIACRADDKVISVDPANGLITIDQRGALASFRVKPGAEITLNGTKVTLQQILPGMMVTYALAPGQTLTQITARGTLIPAAKTTTVPSGTTSGSQPLGQSTNADRSITLKARVDGNDLIKIKDGRLWIEHLGAKKPIEISVNGIKWEPDWDRDTSRKFSKFTPKLAPFGASAISVTKVGGRGLMKVVESPSAENKQTLSFQIQDGGNGADLYEILVTW